MVCYGQMWQVQSCLVTVILLGADQQAKTQVRNHMKRLGG